MLKYKIAAGLVMSLIGAAMVRGDGPWSTYRGNTQRTGHTDGQPGPASPKVLWALKSTSHYIASPLPVGDRLFVSGLGAFNVANFQCLSTDVKAKDRILW